MYTGIQFELPFDYQPEDTIQGMIANIAIEPYLWRVDSLWGEEQWGEEYCSQKGIIPFAEKTYSCTEFSRLVNQKQCFIFLHLSRWSKDAAPYKIATYCDYLNSECDFMLLCYDACYFEIYSKDENVIINLADYLHAKYFINIECFANHNSPRKTLSIL